MKKVGIVLISRDAGNGGGELLQLTRNAIEQAKNDLPWALYALADQEGLHAGFDHFLQDPAITHICLIRAGLIVPRHWLDRLVRDGLDAAAPVANAAGNEQEIAVDIDPARDESGFAEVNDFAEKRRAVFHGCLHESERVSFLAVVFARHVVETVGAPDERFHRGAFADEDYCLRVRNAGFRLWVLRDVYVHDPVRNLGVDRSSDFRENKQHFEEKWSTQWKDPKWKLLESVLQDEQFLALNGQTDLREQDLLARGIRNFERIYNAAVDEAMDLRERNNYLQARLKDELPFGENIRQITSKIRRRLSRGPTGAADRVGTGICADRLAADGNRLEKSDQTRKLLSQALAYIDKSPLKPICVLAPMFSPENITDGYVQRVKAVDEEVLGSYLKVYVQPPSPSAATPSAGMQAIDAKHLSLQLDLRDRDQAKVFSRIVSRCEMIYIHSALRVMKEWLPAKLRDQALGGDRIKIIWDVHGAVPEEFEMQGDPYRAELAADAESFLASRAELAIAVSHAMKRHLARKYEDRLKAAVEVMPIFNADLSHVEDFSPEKGLAPGQPPLAVYAGGLQKWQKISEMQDLISRSGDLCRYVVLVNRPEEFLHQWGVRPCPSDMRVEHRTPDETLAEYRYCHYGFALRDDTAVNHVACPTKLIEYIQYGILPVLDTPNIGDFAEMGMSHITVSAFERGRLPDETERRRMAENNYALLNKLTDLYLAGRRSVTGRLSPEGRRDKHA